MKVSKKGLAKLERGEIRLGNFFVKKEDEYIKIQDLNSLMSHRVSRDTSVGRLLQQCLDEIKNGNEGAENFLDAYCSVLHYFSSVVPVHIPAEDGKEEYDFFSEIILACNKCIEKARDVYGFPSPKVSEQKSDDILQEQKMLHKDMEELMK